MSMPQTDPERAHLFNRLALALPSYASRLGLSSEDLEGQALDAAYFHHVLSVYQQTMESARNWEIWKESLLHGGEPSQRPDPQPLVTPGIIDRFRALVQRIKSYPGYTEAIGSALGIKEIEASRPAGDGAPRSLTTLF